MPKRYRITLSEQERHDLEALVDPAHRRQFFDVFEWYLDEIKAAAT